MSDPQAIELSMTEIELVRHPAIMPPGKLRIGELMLETVTEGGILQILGRAGSIGEPELRQLCGLENGIGKLRFAGPGQWFLVVDDTPDLDAVAARLAGIAQVIDQTHGRCRIRLSGKKVRDVLAKGTAVDLHAEAFATGHSVMTQVGHIGTNIARTGDDCFEILVLRGFAESLWHELQSMAAEFA